MNMKYSQNIQNYQNIFLYLWYENCILKITFFFILNIFINKELIKLNIFRTYSELLQYKTEINLFLVWITLVKW